MTTKSFNNNSENANVKSNATASAKKKSAPKSSAKKAVAKEKARTAEEIAAAKAEAEGLFAGITLPTCVSQLKKTVIDKLAEIDSSKSVAKNQAKIMSGANAVSKMVHGDLELHCRTMMGDAFIRSLWIFLLKKADIKGAGKLKSGADLAALVGDNMRGDDGVIKMPVSKANPRYWEEEKKTTKMVDGKKVVTTKTVSHGGDKTLIKHETVKSWNDAKVILAVLLSQKAEGCHTSIEKYEELAKDANKLAAHKSAIADNTVLVDAFNAMVSADRTLTSKTDAYNQAVKEKKGDKAVATALQNKTSAQDAFEKAKAAYDKAVAKAEKAEAAAKKAEAAEKKSDKKSK